MSIASTSPVDTSWREEMMPRPARVTDIKPEASGIATFQLALESINGNGHHFEPGQYNMLYLPGFGEVPISISSDPASPEQLGHTIRFAGMVTQAMSRLKVGDRVGIRGPYGSAWPVRRARGGDVVIATGGIGMAPLRPVIYHIIRWRKEYERVILLYGARTPEDLLYKDEVREWEKHNIEVQITVDRADATWRGQIGVVPMLFYRVRLNPKHTVVLTCGPEIMMRFAIFEALARKVPKENVYLSMERNMKCGIGFCGHCQLGPHFICQDGAVFPFVKVEKFFGKEDF